MSIITTQLDALWAVKTQDERVVEAKAVMQGAYFTIQQANARVQEIVNMGTLNAVPTETKAALNAAWAALKICQTALEVATVAEALNWVGQG